jgi:hypothetical protein
MKPAPAWVRRIILFAALLVTAMRLPAADVPTDLSGTWVGRYMAAGDGARVERSAPANLSIVQSGSIITGTFTGEESRAVKIESGRIGENGKITFWLRDSQNFLFTAQLTASGGWIRGRITSSTGRLINVALKKQ